jgi:hypothetical protein
LGARYKRKSCHRSSSSQDPRFCFSSLNLLYCYTII